jgi:hypothetical protein
VKPREDLLRRMEDIYDRITKRNEQFSTLYLETVPRSFIQITHEERAQQPAVMNLGLCLTT